MANEIKPLISSSSALTITLASLANSTSGVGRQSTLVDNSSTRYGLILLAINIMTGTTPTAGGSIKNYALRSDGAGTAIIDDGAGASDAAWTQLNADYCYRPESGLPAIFYPTTTSNVAQKGNFVLPVPGPGWGVGVVNSSGAALHATGGNHVLTYRGLNPEIQ